MEIITLTEIWDKCKKFLKQENKQIQLKLSCK
jgi:hypothetical protein